MDNQAWKKRDWDWHKTITKKCVAPWHSLTIEWDGEVYADAVAFKPYGSIYENTLTELWNSPKAVDLRKSWSKGLPDNIMNKCDVISGIQMPGRESKFNSGGVRSINLSVACGIVCYSACLQLNLLNN